MDEMNIQQYIERYAKTYNVTPEEAQTHKLVQEVELYYKESQEGGCVFIENT